MSNMHALDKIAALRQSAGLAQYRADSAPSNMDIKNLIEEGNKAYHEFKQYVERRLDEIDKRGEPSAETEQTLANINARMDQVLDDIKNFQDQRERIDELEAALNRGGLGDGGGGRSGFDAEQVSRFNALLANEVHRGREQGVDAKQISDYKAALLQYARMGNSTPESIRAELNVGSDPEGGYWVTPDMEGRIIQYLYDSSMVRQAASVETIGTESLTGDYDLDEVGFGWVGESDSRGETSTPELGEWEIFAHEMYAMPQATQKMLDDSMRDVEAWLTDKIQRRFRRAEETAFVNGNGVKKPRGFLTYTASTNEPTADNFQRIQKVATGASGDFNGTDPANIFIDVQAKLKRAYRSNARWAMNRATMAEVRKLQDGQGDYLLIPDFANPGAQQILGDPVEAWDDMPDIAAGSLSIAYADWAETYTIVDRVGIRLLRDPYTTKGKVKFYATRRVGGSVVNFDSIKLIAFES